VRRALSLKTRQLSARRAEYRSSWEVRLDISSFQRQARRVPLPPQGRPTEKSSPGSEGYNSKAAAEKGIESVRTTRLAPQSSTTPAGPIRQLRSVHPATDGSDQLGSTAFGLAAVLPKRSGLDRKRVAALNALFGTGREGHASERCG
jgi:hypothetical protein